MPCPAIELVGLAKTFGRGKHAVHALRRVDLAVAAGQVFGFLGANGAGKSTTIRMMVDLVRPTSGQVLVHGQDVRRHPEALQQVGALVEGAHFYPHLNARRNLEVLARTRGRSPGDEIELLLEQVSLAEDADRPVEAFSMGMKQRLGVAAALMGRPPVVILDEPTNGLDPAGIRQMRRFLRDLAEVHGQTVFLSSHLLHEVQEICDRVAILSQGRVVREGRVKDLLNDQDRIRVEAAPLDQAAKVLSQTFQVEMSHGAVVLSAPPDAIPEVVRLLVNANVDVLGVGLQVRSLEDSFFEAVTDREVDR